MSLDDEIFNAFHDERGTLRHQFREHVHGFRARSFVLAAHFRKTPAKRDVIQNHFIVPDINAYFHRFK